MIYGVLISLNFHKSEIKTNECIKFYLNMYVIARHSYTSIQYTHVY